MATEMAQYETVTELTPNTERQYLGLDHGAYLTPVPPGSSDPRVWDSSLTSDTDNSPNGVVDDHVQTPIRSQRPLTKKSCQLFPLTTVILLALLLVLVAFNSWYTYSYQHCATGDTTPGAASSLNRSTDDTNPHIINNSRHVDTGNVETLLSHLQQYVSSCQDAQGGSGLYWVEPRLMARTSVYCDMTLAGGGWMVLLRRQDGSVNFTRDWSSYQAGFGDLTGDFWAGTELMHLMTSIPGTTYRLRFDMKNYFNEHRYAEYDSFRVGAEAGLYRLHIGEYSGTAGDSMRAQEGKPFSTVDNDNDDSQSNCAERYKAGWWFSACFNAILTGEYGQLAPDRRQGILWNEWLGFTQNLETIQMAIRPT